MEKKSICTIRNCPAEVFNKGKGWCGKHYNRWRRNGSPHKLYKEKHGMARSIEYETWHGMKHRCYNKSYTQYEDYGGRGIVVCDRWKNSFKAFYEDMGPKPKGMSLDRIDTNGNYEPNNCRWATYTQQILSQRIRSTNKTGYKGVVKRKNKFYAVITVNYKYHHIGVFNTAKEASEAFLAKQKELRS